MILGVWCILQVLVGMQVSTAFAARLIIRKASSLSSSTLLSFRMPLVRSAIDHLAASAGLPTHVGYLACGSGSLAEGRRRRCHHLSGSTAAPARNFTHVGKRHVGNRLTCQPKA